MRLSGKLLIWQAYPLNQDIFVWKDLAVQKPTASLFHHIGKYSLDALEQVVGRCATIAWVYEFVRWPELVRIHKLPPAVIERLKPIAGPDLSKNFNVEKWLAKNELDNLSSEVAEETIVTTLFGAAMLEIWKEAELMTTKKRASKLANDKRLDYLLDRCDKAIKKCVKKNLPLALDLVKEQTLEFEKEIKVSRSAYKKLIS